MKYISFLVIIMGINTILGSSREVVTFDNQTLDFSFLYLYSHGIADTALQAHNIARAGAIGLPYITFDYPDSCLYHKGHHKYSIFNYLKLKWNFFVRGNYKESSLGQIYDIQALYKAYEQAIKELEYENKAKKIIIFGNSRGASTIIPMIALYKPKNIAAVIAMSPFDEIENILAHLKKRSKLGSIISLEKAQAITEYIFQKYSRYGVRLIDLIKKIDFSIPTLIICSKEDSLIPYQISVAVYSMLRNAGMKHIHLFITDHGAHGKILEGPDRKKCVSVIHAFYKKYHLPYNEELASLGDPLLL